MRRNLKESFQASLFVATEAARQLADDQANIKGIEFQDLRFMRGVVIPDLRVLNPGTPGGKWENSELIPTGHSWMRRNLKESEAARQLADDQANIKGIEFQDLRFMRGVVIPDEERNAPFACWIQAPPEGSEKIPNWYQPGIPGWGETWMLVMATEAARQLADDQANIKGIEFQDLRFMRGVVTTTWSAIHGFSESRRKFLHRGSKAFW
jgi:hypothetical protein